MMFFWVKSPCGLVDRNRRFEEACCLHLQGWSELNLWWWKPWLLPTSPHGEFTQNNIIRIITAVITLCFTYIYHCSFFWATVFYITYETIWYLLDFVVGEVNSKTDFDATIFHFQGLNLMKSRNSTVFIPCSVLKFKHPVIIFTFCMKFIEDRCRRLIWT
jgi:hypothetical protein